VLVSTASSYNKLEEGRKVRGEELCVDALSSCIVL